MKGDGVFAINAGAVIGRWAGVPRAAANSAGIGRRRFEPELDSVSICDSVESGSAGTPSSFRKRSLVFIRMRPAPPTCNRFDS